MAEVILNFGTKPAVVTNDVSELAEKIEKAISVGLKTKESPEIFQIDDKGNKKKCICIDTGGIWMDLEDIDTEFNVKLTLEITPKEEK